MSAERVEAFFKGMVQGVGFRFTALRISRDYNITGFVRNLTDGRVQLVAEGEREELQSFIVAVESRLKGYITGVAVSWCSATGQYSGFDTAF